MRTLSDEAKLLLLKERLGDVKKKKIFYEIGLFISGFVLSIYIEFEMKMDFIFGFIVFIVIAVIGGATVGWYYDSQKERIIREIEKMAQYKCDQG